MEEEQVDISKLDHQYPMEKLGEQQIPQESPHHITHTDQEYGEITKSS
jgi:hypothetical protein